MSCADALQGFREAHSSSRCVPSFALLCLSCPLSLRLACSSSERPEERLKFDPLKDQKCQKAKGQSKEAKESEQIPEDLATGIGQLLEQLAVAGDEPQRVDLAATLTQLASHHPPLSTQQQEGTPGDILNQLFGNGFSENAGTTPEMSSLLDTIMQQLLSKEVLYQPMTDIAGKYPSWLRENEERLEKGDADRYRRQYSHILSIIEVYETDPENYGRLVQVLQEMQACGQPPQDIVDDLAPGMKFGEDGGLGDLPAELGDCCIT